MAQHNYIRKIERFAAEHGIPKARLSEIGVYHDPWCGINRGGRCNCDPDVRLLVTHPRPARGGPDS
jgi:hypothetical protein